MNNAVFFLGASSGGGYISYFGDAYTPSSGGKYYLLKGGPGTGKSSFMREAAQSISREGYEVRYVTCSADPDSLDAVLFPELNAGIFDATSPHTMDPMLPGACEQIINLGDYWDISRLRKNRSEIARLTKENSLQHKKAAGFLTVASRFSAENIRLASRCVDSERLGRYTERLCMREIKGKGTAGREQKCFLSGITPFGCMFHIPTITAMADKIIAIEDNTGAVSSAVVEAVSDCAVEHGYNTFLCMCPLCPDKKAEHVIIPELRVGVITLNRWHGALPVHGKKTHASRFIDAQAYITHSERISFNEKAKEELLGEAVNKLQNAKAVHDELERLYSSAMDFTAVKERCKTTIKDILS